ncbi:ABC transporter permease subunit [Pseudomonas sp. PDM14]|uniref:ABC transporter permease subunit n=1 Tax=Pseudomonas sp. PDM14 TaxID=2769288 RepID=UPI00177BB1AD|nr:ABC transporter permease subunit [Pseudomonas sp. PDM14]MBD9485440.1 ABC transporter permease subunit [Pseudomonas sp. PDM14]
MLSFLARRLGLLLPTLIGVTLLTFGLIRLVDGDPVDVMMGERGLSPERHAAALKELGLDRPLPEQYLHYLGDVLSGDLGHSLRSREAVWDEFLALFPATAELALAALLFATLLGLPAGIIAALRRGKTLDHGVMGLALTGYSMPIFWWGLMLILLFSVGLGWTPVSGRTDLIRFDIEPVTGFMLIDAWLSGQRGAVLDALHHLLLPAIVLGTIPLAVIARMTRSAMLEVMREDYIRSARARGLSPARVVLVHALRNAWVPVLTVFGLQVGTLLGGAVLTETLFSWPGIGKWLIEAIGARDYPVVQSGILLIACLVILSNFTVDLLYGLANPRIRHRQG